MGRNYHLIDAMKDTIALIGITLALAIIVACSTAIVLKLNARQSSSQQPFGLSVCSVTTTLISIGNQAPTTILGAGARSWAIIQQPVNATNTVALSLGGTAAIGTGYELTPATTTSPVSSLAIGYATPLPFQGSVSARTSAGSTTVKVITCQ